MIQFFNTYTGHIEPFHPIQKGKVKIYTCGPTVYSYAHVGNYRAYMFEDLLKRFLRFMGNEVIHVMNITDVDDKTIKGANDKGVSLAEYTQEYIEAFFDDLNTLNIILADHYPRATAHIPEMVRMIKMIIQKGYAYEKDGSYYFDISKFKDYGKLAKVDTANLKPGQRLDSDEYEKESIHDFALWKAPKQDEPFWETDIGPGRPGWHIECSAMSSKYLGESFDIHCGGVDNIFPHHENEIAQSEAATGKRFVRYWLHCQHLIRDGEKMSKSKGNIITISELVEKYGADPMALRFLLLSTHYRKMMNFTFEALNQAEVSLQRIKDFIYELKNQAFEIGMNQDLQNLIKKTKQDFTQALCDDLNISMALSAVFGLIKDANILLQSGQVFSQDGKELLSLFDEIDRVLGVLPGEKDQILSEEIQRKIEERERAREEKNYALADKIRDDLLEQGVILEDAKDGVRWKLKRQKL